MTVTQQTREQIRAFADALPAPHYRLNFIPRKSGVKPAKPVDATAFELLVNAHVMQEQNDANECDVYARPYNMGIVMVDDVKPKFFDLAMSYGPALVVETSRRNYQFWYRQRAPYSGQHRVMKAISKWLAIALDGDESATGLMQLARVPGFRNRKEGRKAFLSRIVKGGYRPGQMANLPEYVYTTPITRGRGAKATVGQGTKGKSVRPMSQKEKRRSAHDWQYCMKRLEDSNGMVTRSALRWELQGVSDQTMSGLESYISRTVENASDYYKEKRGW